MNSYTGIQGYPGTFTINNGPVGIIDNTNIYLTQVPGLTGILVCGDIGLYRESIIKILEAPIEEIALYINDLDPLIKKIASLRLKSGV